MKARWYFVLAGAVLAVWAVFVIVSKILENPTARATTLGTDPQAILFSLYHRLREGNAEPLPGGGRISAESISLGDDGVLTLGSVRSVRGVVITCPVAGSEHVATHVSRSDDDTTTIQFLQTPATTGATRTRRMTARAVKIWIANGELLIRLQDVEMRTDAAIVQFEEQTMRAPLNLTQKPPAR